MSIPTIVTIADALDQFRKIAPSSLDNSPEITGFVEHTFVTGVLAGVGLTRSIQALPEPERAKAANELENEYFLLVIVSVLYTLSVPRHTDLEDEAKNEEAADELKSLLSKMRKPS